MKTLNIYAALMFSIFAINFSFAQKSTVLNAKEQIKVWGNCESCKKRIETAANSAGATTANWNEESHMLTVSYDGANTSSEKIQKAIAVKGHDTQNFKADDDVYRKLPGCCKYERNNSLSSVNGKSALKSGCKNPEACKDKACYKDGKCDKNLCKDIPECKSNCCSES